MGQQRGGTVGGALLVYVMHAELAEPVDRDGAREHGKRVQFALPSGICARHAIGPFGGIDFVQGASVIELVRLSRASASSEMAIWKAAQKW
ncbi:hypothetical protein H4582DRAFT_2072222 [Lactarius indigo]|nr:hypothetical protein H4582DRAFT_2072222 [Lactarius indigo]